jgi:hypothetical protein
MSSFSTTTARPATSSGTSVETTWLGKASWLNHHSDSWVSTTPLSGICVGRTWSKAEIASVATIRMRPPGQSYSRRTLPTWIGLSSTAPA